MTLKIVEERPERLSHYASVPIRYKVTEIFDDAAIEALARGTLPATTPLAQPFRKDYDALPDNHPTDWINRFDVSHWILLAAYHEGTRVSEEPSPSSTTTRSPRCGTYALLPMRSVKASETPC